MTWRKHELVHLSSVLSWLPDDVARRDFSLASLASSRERYGLDEQQWEILERWDVESAGLIDTRSRLAVHAVDSELVVYFGPKDVCRMPRNAFLDHWQDMFMPSRDDVLIMPISGVWCLFYCHEDEFEAGRRRRPNQALQTTPVTRSEI